MSGVEAGTGPGAGRDRPREASAADGGMRELVGELRAEQEVLDRLVRDEPLERWLLPTPAAGWDVRDSISHLAAIDEVALECVTGDGVALLAELSKIPPDEATRRQCDRGLDKDPEQMLAWWRGSRERLNEALLELGPGSRVPWGAGPMAARSFVTARLMECWAHGLDCFSALGAVPRDTDRLRHVCHIAYRALPYAFRYAGRTMPGALDELRIEVSAPDGVLWTFGPQDAPCVITGSAGDWARVAVQRMRSSQATTLTAEGRLAQEALTVARAYF